MVSGSYEALVEAMLNSILVSPSIVSQARPLPFRSTDRFQYQHVQGMVWRLETTSRETSEMQ